MLDSYNVILTNAARNLKKNIEDSPFLYFLFGVMIVFSMATIALLTLFFMKNEVLVDLHDVFFLIFFVFILKSSYDFHEYYIKSEPVVYSLSSPVKHTRVVFEFFLMVFWNQLGLWVLFSSLYSFFLAISGVNISFPLIYLQFTFGVMLSVVIGTLISLHFFSKHRLRLIPVLILVAILWFRHDIYSIVIILAVSLLYLFWSLRYVLNSYLFVNRKNRKKEKNLVGLQGVISSVFNKEITVLWREKILFSLIFSAVSLGVISGYLAQFGEDSFLPETLKFIVSKIATSTYAFLGIYVITVYSSIFISLSFFLNEENTLWIIHHLPVDVKKVIRGKALGLSVPFACSIPFVAYFSAFTLGDSLVFLVWFFVFSFLAGVIISFPLGAKYIGKKSDVLLLYSVSMLMFVVLGIGYSFYSFFKFFSLPVVPFFAFTLFIEIILLFFSLNFSSYLVSLNYNK